MNVAKLLAMALTCSLIAAIHVVPPARTSSAENVRLEITDDIGRSVYKWNGVYSGVIAVDVSEIPSGA